MRQWFNKKAFLGPMAAAGLMTTAAEAAAEADNAPGTDGAEAPIKFSYGGQAVMDGVMMRGAYNMAVAVRNPEGEIIVHEQPINAALYRGPISKIPFVRGLTLLWDSLGLGTRALMWSADIALGEEEDVSFNGPLGYGTLFVSLAFGVGLFFLLPTVAASGVRQLWNLLVSSGDMVGSGVQQMQGVAETLPVIATAGANVAGAAVDDFATNIIEGIIRLMLIIGYIWVIGRIPDIARVFKFHGAEHKTINAYEAGSPLTPSDVARYPLEHPRCGTGFILVVGVISILVFSVLGRPALIWLLLSRVVLIPVIAGIAYEYIKFTAGRMDQAWVRVLVKPSLALQALTTNEPEEDILEVAIVSLQRVLATEKAHLTDQPVVGESEEVVAAAG